MTPVTPPRHPPHSKIAPNGSRSSGGNGSPCRGIGKQSPPRHPRQRRRPPPRPGFHLCQRSPADRRRPRSGDDTYDLIDDPLYQLAERRGKWLGDPIAAMTLIASLIGQAERMIPQLAHDARENGATWHDIATALATSPEQAEHRYSPDSPVADSRWPYDY